MYYIEVFLLWTFVVYWMHRLAHIVPFLSYFHSDHHKQVSNNTFDGLNWKNLFLYFDSFKSTIDQWLVEVIPTIIISYFFGWWLFICYYIWAALIQESIEHNNKINLYPFLTSGRWHLIHHSKNNFNYGIFVPLWDLIFKTWKPIND